MHRRGFFKTLFGGVAAAAVATAVEFDPERLLYVPGAKSFFIPHDTIAIKNVRLASDQEVAQVTGQHLLRIKYWEFSDAMDRGTEKIAVVSERAFHEHGHIAYPHVAEIHFDNGGVLRLDHALKSRVYNVPELRAQADAAVAKNIAVLEDRRRKGLERRVAMGRIPRAEEIRLDALRSWRRQSVILDQVETAPVIRLHP